MKKILLFAIAVVTANCVLAQSKGNAIYSQNLRAYQEEVQFSNYEYTPSRDNEIIIEVNALANVKADSYLAIFNLNQVEKDVPTVNQKMNERIQGFVEGLKKLGIKEEDIYIDFISFVTYYEWEIESKMFSKRSVEVPKGFELQKNVHVRYKSCHMLDSVVSIAAQNEIYDLARVEYFVNDIDKHIDTLRNAVAEKVKERFVMYKELGVDLAPEFHLISEDHKVYYPYERYSSYKSYNASSKIKTSAEKSSYFYEPVSNKKYDIVLNADYLEPVVQISYNMTLKFTMKGYPKEKNNNYYIIDADGNLKPIRIE